jgi:glutamate-1-semialdehyde aminotransferase
MNNIIGLYSKRPEYTGLPIYYDKAKDVYIWIGGKKYLDMSTMGIGCNLLGYANIFIDIKVKQAISKGAFSSLNCYEDYILTEILLNFHPGYKKIRYAKTGGEACKIAMDLAKTFCESKDLNILQIGYNGWHLKNENLIRLNELNDIKDHKDNKFDIVIFELVRNRMPDNECFEILNKWQNEGAILICDEITTGFRFRFGGLYLDYPINPDIVVFGKALSNGYPLSAIMMNWKITSIENDIFISSTYYTDRIGVTAAIETIKNLYTKRFRYLDTIGNCVRNTLILLSKKYGFEIKFNEINQLLHWDFVNDRIIDGVGPENKIMLTFFVEKMLEYSIITGNSFYPCFKHTAKHINYFFKCADKVFNEMKIKKEHGLYNFIQGKIIQDTPVRLVKEKLNTKEVIN